MEEGERHLRILQCGWCGRVKIGRWWWWPGLRLVVMDIQVRRPAARRCDIHILTSHGPCPRCQEEMRSAYLQHKSEGMGECESIHGGATALSGLAARS